MWIYILTLLGKWRDYLEILWRRRVILRSHMTERGLRRVYTNFTLLRCKNRAKRLIPPISVVRGGFHLTFRTFLQLFQDFSPISAHRPWKRNSHFWTSFVLRSLLPAQRRSVFESQTVSSARKANCFFFHWKWNDCFTSLNAKTKQRHRHLSPHLVMSAKTINPDKRFVRWENKRIHDHLGVLSKGSKSSLKSSLFCSFQKIRKRNPLEDITFLCCIYHSKNFRPSEVFSSRLMFFSSDFFALFLRNGRVIEDLTELSNYRTFNLGWDSSQSSHARSLSSILIFDTRI